MFHSMLAAYAILLSTLYGRHFAGQDFMGFGKIAWLTEGFTFLDGVRLNV